MHPHLIYGVLLSLLREATFKTYINQLQVNYKTNVSESLLVGSKNNNFILFQKYDILTVDQLLSFTIAKVFRVQNQKSIKV